MHNDKRNFEITCTTSEGDIDKEETGNATIIWWGGL
jgi:hypothetical protein